MMRRALTEILGGVVMVALAALAVLAPALLTRFVPWPILLLAGLGVAVVAMVVVEGRNPNRSYDPDGDDSEA